MGLLTRFDITSDYYQFFIVLSVLLVLVAVLLSRIAPQGRRRRQKGRVDDRFVNREGELIE